MIYTWKKSWKIFSWFFYLASPLEYFSIYFREIHNLEQKKGPIFKLTHFLGFSKLQNIKFTFHTRISYPSHGHRTCPITWGIRSPHRRLPTIFPKPVINSNAKYVKKSALKKKKKNCHPLSFIHTNKRQVGLGLTRLIKQYASIFSTRIFDSKHFKISKNLRLFKQQLG